MEIPTDRENWAEDRIDKERIDASRKAGSIFFIIVAMANVTSIPVD